MFWMFAFPFILSTVFYLAFSNLDKGGVEVKMGINEENALVGILENIEVFDLVYAEEGELKDKLLNEEVDAFLSDDYEVNVSSSSLKANVAVDIIEQIRKYSLAYMLSVKDELKIPLSDEEIMGLSLADIVPYMTVDGEYSVDGIEENLNSKIDYETQEGGVLRIVLFTAVAMFSLYSAFTAVRFSEMIQGYLSEIAMRVSVSPFTKLKLILSTFVMTFLVNIVISTLVIVYINFVLGVKLFSDFALTALILVVASIFGIAFGTAIGIIKGLKAELKTTIINVVLLVSSFLCGMGGDTGFKQDIAMKAPIFNMLNPVNLVNESLYKVNLIGSSEGVYLNLGILLGGAAILLLVSGLFLRRESYDSI